ncbi:flagellar basal body P-ring formation protein FlgA [Escherichia coli]|uniref:flagellar basal body P-ring formation chaperone FlgA n=1 Tax=Escherichia sp. MOD1-EC4550 TaxID=2093861 RepID=UPI000CF7A6A0|nr:flagellar basal body P-ring formation chaperone FlgA [Escherichia sp. MOD1-EC4550]EGO8686463.1 flagellar basal body P-ring formation protein FlgA [Escherichia coli]EGO8722996.1 flagellar basal body P-ring formation protein FlgA [Escherichia coli]EME6421046.1 flagellar basal body P-ring formation protein FlgA [Escherichia coli]MCS1345668.1 flagellar basal body P-ring formation chaperone FlgA [Escherichia coli]HAW4050900.1 flagellar basal body P-ring formation protein FlgA [Escherichia coli]
MLTIKRSVAIIAILFSPLSAASNLTSQLQTFFSAQLAGVSDEVRVSIRTSPHLLPPCEQPLFSISNNSRLWGNVNVLARCGNDKRYLQVNVQATGNYVVAAMPIVRGGKLEAGNVKLKRGRLDTLPPRTVLDINQLIDAVSLRDLSPEQPIQLTQLRQAWRVKAGQRVNVIANGDGFSANAEGQALNNAAVAQNARVRMVSGQVISGVVDADGNILINL